MLTNHHKKYIKWMLISLLIFFGHFSSVLALKVTAKLISKQNYPVEEHIVHTPDHYILTVYRIPNSPKLPENTNIQKPVVFLQHGILCASDDWILNGPTTSIAYLFADAGYDVWLANSRGNTYSRQHKYLTPDSTEFWSFSWHEIGVYDVASTLDYVLNETSANKVHFVAHSQGTTAFFVLMSSLPAYNDKMKTVHLLAPIAFMRNHSFLLSKLGGLLGLGNPSFITWILAGMELLPITSVQKFFCEYVCSESSILIFLCSGLLDFIGGWGSKQTNQTLLTHVCETHPAGASTTQIIHYLQLYTSGSFRQYDHGIEMNKHFYSQETPPAYEISNINACVDLYYSDNDYMSAVQDVEHLATLLPCADLYHIPFKDWNHYDFLWSNNVKEVINDKIIAKMNKYEIETS